MKRAFGTLKTKEKAELYLLKNEKGMEVAISDYGATIVNVIVPDMTMSVVMKKETVYLAHL